MRYSDRSCPKQVRRSWPERCEEGKGAWNLLFGWMGEPVIVCFVKVYNRRVFVSCAIIYRAIICFTCQNVTRHLWKCIGRWIHISWLLRRCPDFFSWPVIYNWHNFQFGWSSCFYNDGRALMTCTDWSTSSWYLQIPCCQIDTRPRQRPCRLCNML